MGDSVRALKKSSASRAASRRGSTSSATTHLRPDRPPPPRDPHDPAPQHPRLLPDVPLVAGRGDQPLAAEPELDEQSRHAPHLAGSRGPGTSASGGVCSSCCPIHRQRTSTPGVGLPQPPPHTTWCSTTTSVPW